MDGARGAGLWEEVVPRAPYPECVNHLLRRPPVAGLYFVSILKTGNSLSQNVSFPPCQNLERRSMKFTSLKPGAFPLPPQALSGTVIDSDG